MTQALAQALLSTQLAQVLTPAEASKLAEIATERRVKRGAHLFRAGEASGSLYVITEGTLHVLIGGGELVVAQLGTGQIVGELEVMTRSLRVATLVAVEDSTLLEIPAAKLDAMLAGNEPSANKLVHTLAKSLARRLAAVNQRLSDKAAARPPALPASAPTGAPVTAPTPAASSGPLRAPLPPPNKPMSGTPATPPAPAAKPALAAAREPAAGEMMSEDDLDVLDKLWS